MDLVTATASGLRIAMRMLSSSWVLFSFFDRAATTFRSKALVACAVLSISLDVSAKRN